MKIRMTDHDLSSEITTTEREYEITFFEEETGIVFITCYEKSEEEARDRIALVSKLEGIVHRVVISEVVTTVATYTYTKQVEL